MFVKFTRENLFNNNLSKILFNISDTVYVYWDAGRCGPNGDNHLWELCGKRRAFCPDEIRTDLCASGLATKKLFKQHSRVGCCHYLWYAEYQCNGELYRFFQAVGCCNNMVFIKQALESKVFMTF